LCYERSMDNNTAMFSDAELIARVKRAVVTERNATAALIVLLAELEERELFLREGYSSMFAYCTQHLRLSEQAAYLRIGAARASRRWPAVLTLLTAGEINLTTIKLLTPCLTDENHEALLDASRGKSKSQMEELIAAFNPQPDVDASVRKLPVRAAAETTTTDSEPPRPLLPDALTSSPSLASAVAMTPPTPRPVVAPLAPGRYLIKVTVNAEARANLKRAQDLLRHSVPTGDPAAIVERALAMLVEQLERARPAKVRKPKMPRESTAAATRHVPASVRRAVWQRDAGQCAFLGTEGRCTETGCLEFHHLIPFVDGGATTVENLQLRCRAHNSFEYELWNSA